MQPQKNDVDLIEFLADRAASVILPHFRALQGVQNKAASGFDPVTEADRAAEAAIREELTRYRPDDGVVGEEFGPQPSRSGRRWVVDPIDGTRGFLMGLPVWGTLIALVEGEDVVLGVMDQPFVGERFLTTPSATFQRRAGTQTPMATRPCGSLSEAVVACTGTHFLDAQLRAGIEKLTEKTRMIRYGTDCYGFALLAAGHLDVCIEGKLKSVDIAPFVPMVERAGGAIVDRTGARLGSAFLAQDYGGDAIAVGDPALLPEVIETLAG